jgi:hypothetical protein
MKELLEQYRHITHQATILVQVTEHSMITLHTELGDALDVINHKADRLAHDIAFALQQQPDDSTKQSDKGPEPINNVLHKPLWAVVPKDEPDDIWRNVDKDYGGLRYRVYLSKENAEANRGISGKAVPVWGE